MANATARHLAVRRAFLGWQCRIRQLAVRRDGGRPSPGMRPLARIGERALGPVVVLMNKREPEAYTAELRHMRRRSNDPAERYASALAFLSAAYYQRPEEFSDRLTALFAAGSARARALGEAGHCLLEFDQYAQAFTLPCAVRDLDPDDPAWLATYWHNSLFNADIPGAIAVLEFAPDWRTASATPAPR
ncbi:MAG: hypothetical protein R3286_04990 [Gammaproteobacteria bacterium]|nr:hypothetical protein [Gammaproteobacteria bacterium]